MGAVMAAGLGAKSDILELLTESYSSWMPELARKRRKIFPKARIGVFALKQGRSVHRQGKTVLSSVSRQSHYNVIACYWQWAAFPAPRGPRPVGIARLQSLHPVNDLLCYLRGWHLRAR